VNEFVQKHFSCDNHFILFASNCPQDNNSEITKVGNDGTLK